MIHMVIKKTEQLTNATLTMITRRKEKEKKEIVERSENAFNCAEKDQKEEYIYKNTANF